MSKDSVPKPLFIDRQRILKPSLKTKLSFTVPTLDSTGGVYSGKKSTVGLRIGAVAGYRRYLVTEMK